MSNVSISDAIATNVRRKSLLMAKSYGPKAPELESAKGAGSTRATEKGPLE